MYQTANDHRLPRQAPRLPSLDGLRAVAVTGVIIFHLGVQARWQGVRLAIANRGEFGVTIFFVLSGFLITRLLLEEERKRGGISLIHFYFRRTFRIFPAAYCYLLVLSVLAVGGVVAVSPSHIIQAALFLRGSFGPDPVVTAHFWTLGVEEQFYLLWPALLFVCPRRHRIPAVVALILGGYAWRVLVLRSTGPDDLYHWRLDAVGTRLLVGCLLALLQVEPRAGTLLSGRLARSRVTAWTAVLTLPLLLSPPLLRNTLWLQTLAVLAACFAVAVILNQVIRDDRGILGTALNHPVVTWVGRLSYSLYVWQQLFCLGPRSRLPTNLFATITTAVASFYFVERPALRLRARLERITFRSPPVEPTPGPLVGAGQT